MSTLNENITRIENAKIAIKEAIRAKGVEVLDNELIDTYSVKIDAIPTSSCNLQNISKTITSNGETVIQADPGFDGIGTVTLNVNVAGSGKCILPNGIKFYQSNLTSYDDFDFSQVKSGDWLFAMNWYLKEFNHPEFAPVGSAAHMFDENKALTNVSLDTSNITSMDHMFAGCKNINPPEMNTSNVTDMLGLYNGANLAGKVIPVYDTSKVTQFGYMFQQSKISEIPNFTDTSKAEDFYQTFAYNYDITEFTRPFDFTNVKSLTGMFRGCRSLTKIIMPDTPNLLSTDQMLFDCPLKSLSAVNCSKLTGYPNWFNSSAAQLTDFGGYTNIKVDLIGPYDTVILESLTKQSILNILNGLYDFRGNGDPDTTRSIKLHPNAYSQLTEEDKLIATNKGWAILV